MVYNVSEIKENTEICILYWIKACDMVTEFTSDTINIVENSQLKHKYMLKSTD